MSQKLRDLTVEVCAQYTVTCYRPFPGRDTLIEIYLFVHAVVHLILHLGRKYTLVPWEGLNLVPLQTDIPYIPAHHLFGGDAVSCMEQSRVTAGGHDMSLPLSPVTQPSPCLPGPAQRAEMPQQKSTILLRRGLGDYLWLT